MNSELTAQLMPVFWLVLGIILAVVEGVSVQLVAIWFAIGAACAAVGALLGASVGAQAAVFLAVSALLLVGTRPFVKKVLRVKKQSTNADRVIGQVGVVRETIDNDLGIGRVSVMGLDWSARAADERDISAGGKVRVLAIDGNKLIVAPYTKQTEDSKDLGGCE